MMKTALIATAVIVAAPPAAYMTDIAPEAAEQTNLNLPEAKSVMVQFSYLELSHDETGFSFAVTDTAAIFVDLEFPGEFHIRIGF